MSFGLVIGTLAVVAFSLSPAARGAQFLPMALSVLYLGHPLPEH